MSSVLLNKKHEEYLISNMKRLQHQSPADAKAWMLTAKFLFPSDFSIQFEAYKIERDYKNAKKAACYFAELMEKFPDEPGLLKEMQEMTDTLRSDSQRDEAVFMRSIFQNFSNNQKYKVLTIVANNCREPMVHCCLMLLLLQELPLQLYQHGDKVINTLLASEKIGRCEVPLNPFRKLLICDAMPAVLFSSNFKINHKLLFSLLQAAIEYFMCYIFTYSEEDIDSDFLKILKTDSSSLKVTHKIWKPLFILIKAAGQQLHWNLVELFSSQNNFLNEMNWEMILATIHKRLRAGSHSSSTSGESYENYHDREIFTCSVIVYFYSLYQFAKLMGPKFFFKAFSSDVHYVLIEGIHALTDGETVENVAKKLKYDRDLKKVDKNPPITVSHQVSTELADQVKLSFVTSIKLWDFIHTNYSLSKEFAGLCKIIGMENWPCFQEFYIDMLIYQSCHKDAISHLTLIIQSNDDVFVKNKAHLQLASCLNYIGEHVKACECLFDVICEFSYPHTVLTNCDIQLPPAKTTHHLHFVSYSIDVILHYCIELLICIYKKKLKMGVKESAMLGHIVILSQYKWPREEEFFLHCIRIIQLNESFCYNKFFDYIIVPGILEEFMFLTTAEGGNVTLDLLPTSTMQIGKQRAVTRGVNKGAKEDLRENMKKQISRCKENLNELFITFIQQERYNIKRIIM